MNSVQELVVADLNDAWVDENIDGFTTVAEWRESVVERLTTNRLNQVRNVVVEKVTDALVALAEIETPEAMVAADLQRPWVLCSVLPRESPVGPVFIGSSSFVAP